MIKDLDRYLAGESTSAEADLVRAWADANPENRATLEVLAEAGAGPAVNVDAAFEKLRREAGVREPQAKGHTRRWLYATAAVIIAVAVAKSSNFSAGFFATTSTTSIYKTQNGQRITVSLGDGISATLAPGSRITFTSERGSSPSRLAVLEGEAVFEVIHEAGTPFVVRTGNISTTVLGTKFSVRKYPEDAEVRVAVADGKVATNGNVLSRGDVLQLAEGGNAHASQNEDIASLMSWVNGTLSFDNATLSEALPVLSRWYDVDFVMSDPSLGARRLTTTLDDTGLSHETLTLITSSLGIRFTRVGRTITLYPGN